ncbi:FxDxF family PEP-CTERM protein [Sphingomonas elodea]|uniref:FxDxF family PEP-CTERM protein n=1 Tax=Sphingomonas elodea TaxID=179878 RepID=UPI00026306C8|nr:FxDxF family PEP-CTERM protein [Sphingomonas elodea]
MKRSLAAIAAIPALFLSATAAEAATTIITPGSQPAGTSFVVAGNIFSGPIAATFGHTGIAAGAFTDLYQFTIPQNGTGSGSVTTGVTGPGFLGVTDLDITSVMVNGIAATSTLFDINGATCTMRGVGTCGASEKFSVSNAMVMLGQLNTVEVTGVSRGLGSYGGNATFIPSGVPEPASWGMMIVGMGGIGFAMRRRRATSTRVSYAA